MPEGKGKVGALSAIRAPKVGKSLPKPVPMVATEDIGRVAAELLQQVWTGRRVVELEGPHRVTPMELGTTFSKVLGRPVNQKVISLL